MRLDKFLVDMGIGSRSQVKEILKKKRVKINGEVQTSPKEQVQEGEDVICLDGVPLHYETFHYFLLHKPAGVISATEDATHRTVLDVLDLKDRVKGLFPVGRLDRDTTGLLLLTDNGPLGHALLSPKKHVDKVYEAQVAGIMTTTDVDRFAAGIPLKDFTTQPAQLEILSVSEADQTCRVRITLSEGKFHQVKRMVAACGKEVTALKRVSMGPLELEESLPEGAYRQLTAEDKTALGRFGVEV